MALAFSGQGGTLWEVMAHDAFFDALGDQSLRVRVREKDPMTLDEALKLACHMEAIARSPPEDDYDDRGRENRLKRSDKSLSVIIDDGASLAETIVRHPPTHDHS